MKYALALASVAWTAAAAPSNNKREPMSMAGAPVTSDKDTINKRDPMSMAGAPVTSEGDTINKRDPMSMAGAPITSEGDTFNKRSPTSLLNMSAGAVAVDTGEFLEPSYLSRRAKSAGDCGGQQNFVDEALADCAKMANLAVEDAKNPSSTLFPVFFKNTDEDTRSKAGALLSKIAKECSSTNQGNAVIRCNDSEGKCASSVNSQGIGALAYGSLGLSNPRILMCPSFFELNENACGRLNPGAVVVHELSHGLGKTQDIGYGIQMVLQLEGSQNLQHADTYGFYASALAQGCTAEDLQAGRAPSGTPATGNGNSTNPDPTQGTGPTKGNPLDQPNSEDPLGDDLENIIGGPSTGSPKTGNPKSKTPKKTRPTTGDPNIGRPQTGSPNTGRPQTGSPNIGNPQTGSPLDGNPLDGNPLDGNPQTGSPLDGNPQTGSPLNGSPLNGSPLNGPGLDSPLGETGDSPFGNINSPTQGSPLGSTLESSTGTGTNQQAGTGANELPDEIKALLPADATDVEVISANSI